MRTIDPKLMSQILLAVRPASYVMMYLTERVRCPAVTQWHDTVIFMADTYFPYSEHALIRREFIAQCGVYPDEK